MTDDEKLQRLMGLGKSSSKKTYYPEFLNNLKTLKAEKAKLDAMFNNAINGIIRIGMDGTILSCNRSAEHISQKIDSNFSADNYKIFDLIGMDLWINLKEKNIKNRVLDMEEILFERNDNKTWVLVNSIYQEGIGEPYFEAFLIDITRRKEYEETIIELNKNLELKVSERTKDLEDFAYIISHDLKAPLRAINQLSHWIIDDYEDKLDNDGKDMLNLLSQRIDKMNKMIDGVLAYSRAGREKDIIEDFNFQMMLEEVISTFSNNKNFKFDIINNINCVRGNRTKFLQIIQNLISNSIKYMDKKNPIIEIKTELNEDDLIFIIKDNGPGIEEKYLNQLFDIFNTAGRDTNNESTGIGLAIVKKLIENMNGDIVVNSVIDKGTSFTITLPRKECINELK